MQFKETSERVKSLLLKHKHYRDNDKKLIAHIWRDDLNKELDKPATHITAMEMLQLFAENKLTNPESIRRSRQKLQEHNPYLRGDAYKQRQASTKQTVENVNSIRTDTQTRLL